MVDSRTGLTTRRQPLSSSLRLTVDDYEKMIATGAFDALARRLEFVHGEIREMNPAGPYHYDYIEFLTYWSHRSLNRDEARIQIQSAILLGDSMPEPDVMWLQPKRYGGQRPRGSDALLIIEVADTSLQYDLGEKAMLYAQAGISDYWVIEIATHAVHQHRQPSTTGYAKIRKFDVNSVLQPLFKPESKLVLEELFSEE